MAGYEVLAVRYGTRTTTRSETFLNFHVYGEPDAAIPMDYYFLGRARRAAHDRVLGRGRAGRACTG